MTVAGAGGAQQGLDDAIGQNVGTWGRRRDLVRATSGGTVSGRATSTAARTPSGSASPAAQPAQRPSQPSGPASPAAQPVDSGLPGGQRID
jgi:hypothetical protein